MFRVRSYDNLLRHDLKFAPDKFLWQVLIALEFWRATANDDYGQEY